MTVENAAAADEPSSSLFDDDQVEEERIDPLTLSPDLYASVVSNDAVKFQSLLALGVPCDYKDDKSKWSSLHWASAHGNVTIVTALLQNGAGADYLATQEKVRAKLVSKAAPASHNKKGPAPRPAVLMDTPLHWAAKKGSLRVCWLLMKHGYSLDDVDSTGNTPLHVAAVAGNVAILHCLIAHGADLGARNNFRNTALDCCSDAASRAVLKDAAAKPPLSHAQRDKAAQAHLAQHASLSADLQAALERPLSLSGPSPVPGVGGGPSEAEAEELEEQSRAAREFGVDEDKCDAADKRVAEMRFARRLSGQVGALAAKSPITTQTLYVEYVSELRETLARAGDVLGATPPEVPATPTAGGGEASATAPEVGGVSALLAAADRLCRRGHSEFWLAVATKNVAGVEKADESTVKGMDKLAGAISAAEIVSANADLVKKATTVLARLRCELELSRAKDSFPEVKLPVADMEPKAAKEYWLEEDPEHPVNIGKIIETIDYPLPDKDTGEYQWSPSVSYTRLKEAFERLQSALEEAKTCEANEEVTAAAAAVLKERKVQMDLLEGKNQEDKEAAIAGAEKLAKKVKAAKKK